jgi:hypothetical protein
MVIAATLVVRGATAQEPVSDVESSSGETTTEDRQSNFAVGAVGGLYQANGVMLLAGAPEIAVVAGAGYAPALVFTVDENEGLDEFHFVHGFQIDADLAIRLIGGVTEVGAEPGYRFNTALGHGFAVGGYAQRRLTDELALRASYGFLIYPDAHDSVRETDQVPDDARLSGVGPILQGGLAIALLVYP